MPLPEYTTLPNVSLDLPINSKVYRAFGPGIRDDRRLRELFAEPEELARTSKLEIAQMALGPDLFAELTADNVGWDAFERVVLAVIAWTFYGREVAEVTWDTGVSGPAIIDHMRAQALSAAAVTDEPKPAAKPRTRRKAG